ncbi:MAG TPA: hypothetical protein VGV68_14575, partial [Terriglobia bacterium]|nr:hypothetical protein [Terriglobia bacterium]
MRKTTSLLSAFLLVTLGVAVHGPKILGEDGPNGSSQALLRLVKTIPLPNVAGRVDHLSFDLKSRRLFVAALGNNTV